jgi:hypothetical protein
MKVYFLPACVMLSIVLAKKFVCNITCYPCNAGFSVRPSDKQLENAERISYESCYLRLLLSVGNEQTDRKFLR